MHELVRLAGWGVALSLMVSSLLGVMKSHRGHRASITHSADSAPLVGVSSEIPIVDPIESPFP